MKAFAVAIIATIVLGLAAAYVLTGNRQYAYEAYATGAARVSHPGSNLVGSKWSGNALEGETKPHGS